MRHLQVSRHGTVSPHRGAHLASRIRKVKCDETFPACRRCISTGRICDGYGVWGGGGDGKDWVASRGVAPPAASVSLLTSTSEEKYYFEWFKCRTSKKIPGLFVLSFWNTLVFQASVNEPAVLHAVLALSSIHKDGNTYRQSQDCPDEQEQVMLSNYSKAISHLKPHFSSKDRSSVRVALITCVLFVCVEFFRGHFKTAQTHLTNGLKVLGEMHNLFNVNEDGLILFNPCLESIDEWILEMFTRLHIQVALFNQTSQYSILNLRHSRLETPLRLFRSLNEAWKGLERVFHEVLHLSKQIQGKRVLDIPPLVVPPALLERQNRIKKELEQWFHVYELSRKGLRGLFYPDFEDFAFQLLCTYHTMANIMADTCLDPDNECNFDSFTNQFLSLIEQLVNSWKIRLPANDLDGLALMGPQVDLSRSVVDIGWIPPLYYAALKCRVHRLRLQAIRFLEVSPHREGIWDGKIAACVARKVMEIEERDFYSNFDTADDFPISSYPVVGDLSLPALPQSYRIHGIKVDLPDGPADSIFLSYWQQQPSGDWGEVIQEFNAVRQCWMD